MEGARDRAPGSRGRVLERRHPLRHLAEHARVVELLECLAPEVRARHLADEEDERSRVLVGGVDPDRGVRRARRARDEADPRAGRSASRRPPPCSPRRLVAGREQPDRRVPDRVEHAEVALARDAVRRVHAVDEQLVDQDARGRAASKRDRVLAVDGRALELRPVLVRRVDVLDRPLAAPTRAGAAGRGRRRVSSVSDAVASTGSGPLSNHGSPGP